MNNLNQISMDLMHREAKQAAARNLSVTGNFANEFHRRLIVWINNFHKDLGDEFEVGGQLASFGRIIEFHFTNIGYWDPSLISFIGVLEDGSPVELVQHVSQINVLLIKKKRLNLEQPKRPIGFAAWEDYEKFQQGT
ncbi:DUF6173 family protein [Pantoea sp. GM_Pan_4]|uniref:DUF6173 family protein n=1 Tax=Pantoea sp. GM_Pan_4 TaxID=2937389 RepID=UPI00226A42F0|nr:DUF6173 family protein [Pantoea sp. GM_Pan_4]